MDTRIFKLKKTEGRKHPENMSDEKLSNESCISFLQTSTLKGSLNLNNKSLYLLSPFTNSHPFLGP